MSRHLFTATVLFFGLSVCAGQETVLKSNAELVLVPVSVTDKNGHAVRDLADEDLVLYDNNVPRRVQMEDVTLPISLAIAVQTSPSSQIVLDKLRKVTGLIGPLITGSKGEAAVIAFGGEVRVVQPFTGDEDAVARAIRHLDATGAEGDIAEGVTSALNLLASTPAAHRRVLLLISEKHDMATNAARVHAAALYAQRQNIIVYSVTYSPSATSFTNRVPKYCDRICKACARTCRNCGNQCDREDGKPQPFVPVGDAPPKYGGLGALIAAGIKMAQVNAGSSLAAETGGEQTGFATQVGLEGVVERIGSDLHGQYLLSFTPGPGKPEEFHRLRIEIKGRKDLTIRARPGYWPKEPQL